MRTALTISYLLLMTAFVAGIIALSLGLSQSVLLLIFGATFAVSAYTFILWMKLAQSLTSKAAVVLNQKTNISWSLYNVTLLRRFQEQLTNKFLDSARLISSLTQPDKLHLIDENKSDDAVGRALQSMKKEMLRIKEEEDRRAWVTQGIAKFSEILRHKSSLDVYGNQIIGNLVKYLAASQGALFIESKDNRNDSFLEFVAGYAYGKRGHDKIYPGQGVLGQCMIEKESVLLKDVPCGYVKIASGLGEAVPTNIIVVPLIFDDRFYGAIELASFDQFGPHQLEFLRRLSEDIAAEVAALKNVEQTKALLNESNSLTKTLQERESQMKDNMRALSATQEAMQKKQSELAGIVNAIDNTIASAEFSVDGKFVKANEIFLKVMGFTAPELLGKHIECIMGGDPLVIMMWENLRLGKSFAGEFKLKHKSGTELWLTGTFSPIIVQSDYPDKIMMFAQFTTQEKEKFNELNGVVSAVKTAFPVMEFNRDFVCKAANEKALKILGLSRLQLKSKTFLDFLAPQYHHDWKLKEKNIVNSQSLTLVLPIQALSGVLSYEASVSVVRSLDGTISKITVILFRVVQDAFPVLAVV